MSEQDISIKHGCSAADGSEQQPPPPSSSQQEESSAISARREVAVDDGETCHSPSTTTTGAISPPAQQQTTKEPPAKSSASMEPCAESTRASSAAIPKGLATMMPKASHHVLSGGVTPTATATAATSTMRTTSPILKPLPSTTTSTANQPTASRVAPRIASTGAAAATLVAVSAARPSPPASATAIAKKEKVTNARKSSSGRWTREEHEQFLEGLKVYGREWKKVAQRIPTRTSAQIRSHAQKYFAKLAREEQTRLATVSAIARENHGGFEFGIGDGMAGVDEGIGVGGGDDGTTMFLPPDQHSLLLSGAAISPVQLTSSAMNRVGKILSDPDAVQVEVEDTLVALRRRYHDLQRRLHGNGGDDGLRRPSFIAMHKDDTISSSSDTVSGRKRKIGQDMLTSTTTTSTQKPQKRILESRELWTEELIALSVLGGSLQQGDSPIREQPAVEAIAECEYHSTTCSNADQTKAENDDANGSNAGD
mmetsp:Transcript_7430/g.17679  ORF Transcript_7430/g.17679 Transcript_7430/m.17679 type:complete len:481 (+) Transcript_7430:72-1514(+)